MVYQGWEKEGKGGGEIEKRYSDFDWREPGEKETSLLSGPGPWFLRPIYFPGKQMREEKERKEAFQQHDQPWQRKEGACLNCLQTEEGRGGRRPHLLQTDLADSRRWRTEGSPVKRRERVRLSVPSMYLK